MTLQRRILKEKLVKSICFLAALAASVTLFLIIGTIFLRALPALTPYFIFTTEAAARGVGGGILNDIVGTVILSLTATLIAAPLALGTAVYLQRYARPGRFVRWIRLFIEVLSGTPSIVIGMFGFLVFVYYLMPVTGGYSLISGSVALSILIMPVIERSVEDAIVTVDLALEEGSYALGATKWQTIRGITLPVAIPGIFTGTILGFGRAAEESAVVLMTAGYTQFMPEIAIRANPKYLFGIKIYPFQDLIGTLPISVYNAYENANVIPLANGFAAAFVLICVVLTVNLAARIVLRYGMGHGRRGSTTPLLKRFFTPRRVSPVEDVPAAGKGRDGPCPFQELEREGFGGSSVQVRDRRDADRRSGP